MKNLTLKNIPEALHRKLKTRARRHGRSLNREVIAVLEDTMRHDETDVRKWLDEVRKERARLKVFLTEKELEDAIEAGRK